MLVFAEKLAGLDIAGLRQKIRTSGYKVYGSL